METMHFFHSAIKFIFEDKNSLHFCGPNERFGTNEKLSWGGGGGGQFDKVGQISSRGVCLGFIGASLALIFQRPLRKLAMQYTEIFLA